MARTSSGAAVPHDMGGATMGRLFRWTIGLLVVSSIVELIAAYLVKQRTPSVGDPEDDEVALVAIFAPLKFVSTAGAFRGGSVLLWYGGGEIDLRGATIDPAGARLTVRVLTGGAQVIVPDDWRVDLQVVSILGGTGDARPAMGRRDDAPLLVIDGFAAVGGIGITSSTTGLEIDA